MVIDKRPQVVSPVHQEAIKARCLTRVHTDPCRPHFPAYLSEEHLAYPLLGIFDPSNYIIGPRQEPE
jgi:hypothetical protein